MYQQPRRRGESIERRRRDAEEEDWWRTADWKSVEGGDILGGVWCVHKARRDINERNIDAYAACDLPHSGPIWRDATHV